MRKADHNANDHSTVSTVSTVSTELTNHLSSPIPGGAFLCLCPPEATVTGMTTPVSELVRTPVTGLSSDVMGSTALAPIVIGTSPVPSGCSIDPPRGMICQRNTRIICIDIEKDQTLSSEAMHQSLQINVSYVLPAAMR